MNAAPLTLGGPGPGCSRHRLRRLDTGDLSSTEAEALRAHVAGCLRCQATQAELAHERAELPRVLPFDAFAAGVAERLAAPRRPVRLTRALQIAAPLAAAAALLVVALPQLRPPPADRTRAKGEAGATVHVKDARGQSALTPGEPLAPRAQLLVSLRPAGHAYAAAALWEPTSVSLLFAGVARPGPLPTAFEWDGHGRASLVVRFAAQPIDAAAFVRALEQGGPPTAGSSDAEATTVIPLERP